ncbi:MAG: methylenetetrahydrofolate reductase [NAD(P)H] [Bacteroidia bacterium]|nr:methylenetetrahydrofolate reductase [NAD(P)H] [Bacteroidia bacterium]
MKITDHINNAKETLFSFEILPPLKGDSIESIYSGIDPLMEFKPAFIDVTYHREEYLIKQRPDGLFDRIATKKRPGTVAICAALMNKYRIDAVPHIICGGFTKEDTENALIDLNFLGIDNILALRGDNLKNENQFRAEENGNNNSLELIHQIKNMNSGIYLDEELMNANVTGFCIGAAVYPEKHHDAPNLATDMKFLKRKVEAGAEFLVTQMFFDNKKYFEFVNKCRENNINVPIIPGIKPLTAKAQTSVLPKLFHIDIPFELTETIEKCKTTDDVKKAGVEWCIHQCKELVAAKVPVLHFYTMGRSEATKKIAEQVF